MTRSRLMTLLIASSISILTIALIYFPKESLEASRIGLEMWWKIVFPSLLPFLIISELLIGFGVVKFIGVLFEPLMRPLFRVPGVGGFAWAMGMASGFPAGAKLTARLRQEEQISAIEAERLVSFTNASNPLFIFAAISVGFFENPRLGILLAISHYLGNFCVGLIMRFHGGKEKTTSIKTGERKPYLIQAFIELHRTRLKEKRPFGQLLGDAVTSSIQTLLMIGGFIILFSVFNKLLTLVNVTSLVASVLSLLLKTFQIPAELSIPLISGLFEITTGSMLTSQVEDMDLIYQVIITSFILGFCGFSVQAQVASILAETDIRFKPFFFARILHGFLAAVLSFILWKPLYESLPKTQKTGQIITVFLQEHSPTWIEVLWNGLIQYGPPFTILSLTIYIIYYVKKIISPRV
ncbi:sporulation integral membrane protein YlbJ [Fredinandcohnia quinoae]|uniref:Sporulation integral membrane protein YlbJ n=1 Tax=Fredinandcohnia quinoae TaxID=2918902 RepID=A0AAW5DZP6_9BACI|nr:sporulation integral membrane protein YlbJ [Fredinandcohnia sp. SECRCQ15]MCH1623899.1 sporulation integral membrane protein YlbJ [Fredinandcohnia sp. SECRCQ15]